MLLQYIVHLLLMVEVSINMLKYIREYGNILLYYAKTITCYTSVRLRIIIFMKLYSQ